MAWHNNLFFFRLNVSFSICRTTCFRLWTWNFVILLWIIYITGMVLMVCGCHVIMFMDQKVILMSPHGRIRGVGECIILGYNACGAYQRWRKVLVCYYKQIVHFMSHREISCSFDSAKSHTIMILAGSIIMYWSGKWGLILATTRTRCVIGHIKTISSRHILHEKSVADVITADCGLAWQHVLWEDGSG